MLLLAALGCDSGVGPPGRDGNANVFSHTVTFSMDRAAFTDRFASMQFEVPDITDSVVDEGAVLAFFREEDTWTAMPYTFGIESPDLPAVDYTVTLGYAYEYRFFEVFYEASTEEIDLAQLADQQIRFVVIDGFPYGKTGVDLTDYEQVKAYFGLPD